MASRGWVGTGFGISGRRFSAAVRSAPSRADRCRRCDRQKGAVLGDGRSAPPSWPGVWTRCGRWAGGWWGWCWRLCCRSWRDPWLLVVGGGDGLVGDGADAIPWARHCSGRTRIEGGSAPPQVMRQLRWERSWAPGICWPALRACLMAALSGWVVVLTVSHSGARACSSSISTAWDLRLMSS